MKKGYIVAAVVATSLIVVPSVNAEEIVQDTPVSQSVPESSPEPIEDPRQYPNEDRLAPPSEHLIQQNPWTNSSSAPEGQAPTGQDELESWAVVDQNGNTINIISCDRDYCGSGWIPVSWDGFTPTEWARVVLQGARNPETGNSNGGHWGQYNFPSNVWTQERQDGGTYQIPIEYGQEPTCIANCPVPEENVESPSTPESGEEVATQNDEASVNSEPRSFNIVAQVTKKKISFSKKFPVRKNMKNGNIWVIATKGTEKSVWKFKVSKINKTNIVLPIKYADWNISVNYILKNNKRVSNKIFLI